MVIAAVLIAGVAGTTGLHARTGATDTLQDVVSAGRLAGQDINRLTTDLTQKSAKADAKTKAQIDARLAAARKVQPLLNKLEHDQTFAKQVLEAAGKGQPEGVAAIFGRELGVQMRATELRDFYFLGAFSYGGTKYNFCISSAKECTSTEDGSGGHSLVLEAAR
jgi:hypothetical protein